MATKRTARKKKTNSRQVAFSRFMLIVAFFTVWMLGITVRAVTPGAATLAMTVRADQVKASMRDGVLEIQVPKAEEAKVREIEVQVAS